ncbi:hypothetical protein [Dyadobacter aurulentus]|uniref:hypothetical protein n=1 Tax=Dyadobacter sp. UC 10 TaxID=2605428 RepID=UPI0011F2DECD|nr:hypothetical protein [Dyadobacter sp. UC 10]KAA0992759.1 hypothetical protein FXO21_22570 [Dyadobacter sp. UC 10]
MKYAIEQLDYQLKRYTELLRKSKLLPNPNAEWMRGTKEYEQKVADLSEALAVLTYCKKMRDGEKEIADLYKRMKIANQTGTDP